VKKLGGKNTLPKAGLFIAKKKSNVARICQKKSKKTDHRQSQNELCYFSIATERLQFWNSFSANFRQGKLISLKMNAMKKKRKKYYMH